MAAIHDALSALHGDEKYADLTVTCGEYTFKLHRAVVCPQSPFFEKACSGGFIEAFTGHIDLSEEDPEILAKFFQFIYTGNYADEDHLDPDGCDEAVLQPVEDLLLSLRHGTDLPGSDLYDMSLWNEPKEYYKTFGDIICEEEYSSNLDGRICQCGVCLCDDAEDTGLCEYSWKQERARCAELDYSSDGEEYYEDEELDEELDPGEERYVTDLPHAKGPSVRMYAMHWKQKKSRCAEQNYSSDGGKNSGDETLDGDSNSGKESYVTELPHAMFTSVRMYAIADMFCVPALKVLARNRFYKAVERHTSTESLDFPDVVDVVFETTAPDDWALKDICVLMIRVRCFGPFGPRDMKLLAALQPVLCRHEDLVERLRLLPEMEGRYFEGGGLYEDDVEEEAEEESNVDADSVGTAGWYDEFDSQC